MLKLMLAATALATFTPIEPVIEFTSDSVYKCDDILEVNFEETENFEETYLVNLEFREASRMGYKIYDNSETPYIDGIKWDGEWLDASWKILDVDFSVAHTLQIKTVYTDDYAGMIMSAKDGDWSLMLKNPETILKLVYYCLATFSIVFTVIGTMFNKKHKAKSSTEIANTVTKAATDFKAIAQEEIQKAITSTISPVIKSLVLSKSDKPEDILAMLDLLGNVKSAEDVQELSNTVKSKVSDFVENKKAKVEQAKEDIRKIAEDAVEDVIDNIKI